MDVDLLHEMNELNVIVRDIFKIECKKVAKILGKPTQAEEDKHVWVIYSLTRRQTEAFKKYIKRHTQFFAFLTVKASRVRKQLTVTLTEEPYKTLEYWKTEY